MSRSTPSATRIRVRPAFSALISGVRREHRLDDGNGAHVSSRLVSTHPEIELPFEEVFPGDWVLDALFSPTWALVAQVRNQTSNQDKVSLLLRESEDNHPTWVHRYRLNTVLVRRGRACASRRLITAYRGVSRAAPE
jgi:hypothetical protein